MNNANKSLLNIAMHAAAAPDRPALIMGSGETLTYAELDSRSRRLAGYLRSHGMERGGHVAIVMENCTDYLVACWAAQRCGLYFTPVNWHLTPEESAYIVNNCGAACLITTPMLVRKSICLIEDQIPGVKLRLTTGDGQPGYLGLNDIYSNAALTDNLDECEGGVMFYSSGTTGKPKGIKRPLGFAPWGTLSPSDQLLGSIYGFSGDVVMLCPAPLYHAAPVGWSMSAQRYGGTVIIMERFDEREALRLVETYKATHGHFVPTMFIRFLNLPDEERLRYDMSSLKMVVHAAAPCPVDIKRRMFDWLGPVINEYYAGSEGNGFCAANPQDWLAHPGTVGKPLMGQLHIVDDDGRELPPGEIGMIYFGGTPAFEYHGDAEKTASAYNKSGWSTLGDVGYVDTDGFLYLSDRRTDLIISGGVNIYPRETEDVLLQHPAVLDAAVVGAPSAEFGEDVVGIVELKSGITPSAALAQELVDFCRQKMAHFKCPKRVEFMALPRTETGKLLRRKLKEQQKAAV